MDEAETQFKTATSLDPQYAEAENNLGVVYGQQGKSAEAEKAIPAGSENNPQYAQAFVNLGLILAGQSRFPEANQALQTAVRLERTTLSAFISSDGAYSARPTGGGCHGLP